MRVHPELLAGQQLPPALVTKRIWKERFDDITAFERYADAQRHRDPEVLSARVARGAEAALPASPRRPGEELEILARRREGARPLGRLHACLRGHDSPHQLGRTRRGTWCRPTTSGSPGWSSRPRSSRRSKRWRWPFRKSIARSVRSCGRRVPRSTARLADADRRSFVPLSGYSPVLPPAVGGKHSFPGCAPAHVASRLSPWMRFARRCHRVNSSSRLRCTTWRAQ